MSTICSNHNLTVLEELNQELHHHVYSLRVLISAVEECNTEEYKHEFNRTLWDCHCALQQCASDLTTFQNCLYIGHDMNA